MGSLHALLGAEGRKWPSSPPPDSPGHRTPVTESGAGSPLIARAERRTVRSPRSHGGQGGANIRATRRRLRGAEEAGVTSCGLPRPTFLRPLDRDGYVLRRVAPPESATTHPRDSARANANRMAKSRGTGIRMSPKRHGGGILLLPSSRRTKPTTEPRRRNEHYAIAFRAFRRARRAVVVHSLSSCRSPGHLRPRRWNPAEVNRRHPPPAGRRRAPLTVLPAHAPTPSLLPRSSPTVEVRAGHRTPLAGVRHARTPAL
jgi:hypothetical protein